MSGAIVVGRANDPAEVVADAAAARALRALDVSGGVLRRSASPGPDTLGGTPVRGPVLDVLRRRRGGGSPLPRDVASSMGAAFGGRDFSRVRIHTDGEADRVARSLDAAAFTHGKDVYFTRGSYEPGTEAGRHVLAHELTHTLQPGGRVIRRNRLATALLGVARSMFGRRPVQAPSTSLPGSGASGRVAMTMPMTPSPVGAPLRLPALALGRSFSSSTLTRAPAPAPAPAPASAPASASASAPASAPASASASAPAPALGIDPAWLAGAAAQSPGWIFTVEALRKNESNNGHVTDHVGLTNAQLVANAARRGKRHSSFRDVATAADVIDLALRRYAATVRAVASRTLPRATLRVKMPRCGMVADEYGNVQVADEALVCIDWNARGHLIVATAYPIAPLPSSAAPSPPTPTAADAATAPGAPTGGAAGP
ncbi:MAG TPA: DUF4157 domain-containing protein [Frankiaceae bacterium]|nr:DUF4157 domain-containing protein [Frankiaceae bacterium]